MRSRILLFALAASTAAAQTAAYRPPPPVQPLPFSHKAHVSQGLECKECHAMPEPGEKAGLPATAKCMACHVEVKKESAAIQQLAAFHKKQEPIPWKRVYRVPEYVAFSHKAHVVKAHASCETCHGPVRESDAIRKEKATSMSACMDCHKSQGASMACDYCHEPR
jgi:class III cytochrome C family protein/cytochrome c7-like protein